MKNLKWDNETAELNSTAVPVGVEACSSHPHSPGAALDGASLHVHTQQAPSWRKATPGLSPLGGQPLAQPQAYELPAVP